MKLKLDKPIKNQIIFNADVDGSWVMKLTDKGIFFNRDRYPDSDPDDFAQAVIKILEKEFTVKFDRKHPSCDKNDKSFDPSKTCCEGTENLKNDKTTSGDS
mgnify:FL=1